MVVIASLLSVLVVSLVLPATLRPLLKRWGVIDVPNERSSHSRPTVRGVGVAPLAAMIVGYVIIFVGTSQIPNLVTLVTIVSVSVAAGVVGLVEDIRGLSVKIRAALQVAIGLAGAGVAISSTGTSWWLLPLFGVGVAGYINVANFMDGINGISGLHGLVVGSVYAVLGAITGLHWLTIAGLILALAFAGFLPWNLFRGNNFLGDVGSYLLGGGVSITAIFAIFGGVSPLAVLGVLMIYLTDSAFTFTRRVLKGDPWHEAHRSHIYQRLTAQGLSHLQVSLIVSSLSVATGVAGLLSVLEPDIWPFGVALSLMIVGLYVSLNTLVATLRSRRTVIRAERVLE